MLALALLLLSQATPSKAYVNVENNGADAGFMRVFNITSGGSCTVNQLTNVATCTFSGGGSVTIPNCASGTVLTGDGGVLFCTQQSIPGLPVGSIQYNGDAGGFGGLTKLITNDGQNPTVLPITANPAAPSAGRSLYDFQWTSGMPGIPSQVDSFFHSPNWAGMTPPMSGLGQNGSWALVCHLPDGFNVSALGTMVGTSTTTTTFGSTFNWTFDAGNIIQRQRWSVGSSGAGGPNIWNTMHETLGSVYMGQDSTGGGGFLAWERLGTFTAVSLLDGGTADPSSYIFAGWMPCGTSLTGTFDSSAFTNDFYIGCDAADSNLHACSNDQTGSATCTDLGSAFPCRAAPGPLGQPGSSPHGYDIFFWAPPNATAITWYIAGIDTANNATGTFTDLPVIANYLCWYGGRNSGHDAGSGSSGSMGIGGECVWQHL